MLSRRTAQGLRARSAARRRARATEEVRSVGTFIVGCAFGEPQARKLRGEVHAVLREYTRILGREDTGIPVTLWRLVDGEFRTWPDDGQWLTEPVPASPHEADD